ncbi:TPA: DeoR family transcriptional regulator, partial [Stenotrophomonas maltophilia]
MYARHKEIVALVQGGGIVEVNALAQRFQTSPITIRRDLIELQERGLLERTRGGAVSGEVIA